MLTAWVRGQCKVFFADGVCGEVGQRLYIGPDGNGTCDCEEASLRSSSPPLWFISSLELDQTRGPLLPGVHPSLLCWWQGVEPGNQEETEGWGAVCLYRKPLWRGHSRSQVRTVLTSPSFSVSTLSSTWKDRHCHPLPEEVDDIAECELVPSNVHEDGSRLKCCDPSDRSSCEEQNSINPASLGGGQCKSPGCCTHPNRVYHRKLKKCVNTFQPN